MDWELKIDNKYKERHKTLEEIIIKVVEILKNNGVEEQILCGEFPPIVLPFRREKTYYKSYIINVGFPPIRIEIKKRSAGNIDALDFFNTIRSLYARNIL